MQTPDDAGRERPDRQARVIPFQSSPQGTHARRVAALKRRVEEGTYDADPEAIARALLESDTDVGQ